MKKGFTLVELLLVLAIVIVMATVVILTINPVALIQEGRDATRVADMNTITKAVSLYYSDAMSNPNTLFMGTSSVVYVSIPDATSTAGDQCQGLGLPTLPGGYTYQCAASSTYKKTNGTGWIPVNFTTVTSSYTAGSVIANFPVDPINTTSTNLYYTYQTDGIGGFEVAAFFESQKYASQMEGGSGNDPELYEKGTAMTLPSGRGLVGYWPLNEGSGTAAYDQSGAGNNGTWAGTQAGTSGYYSPGHLWSQAGYANGTNDTVTAGTASTFVMGTSSFSYGTWIYPTAWPSTGPIVTSGADNGTTNQGFTLRVNAANQLVSMICDGSIRLTMTVTGIPTSTWSFVFVTINRSTNIGTAYLNGKAVATENLSGLGSIGQAETLGVIETNYTGEVSDARIYDRSLSATEVQEMYNADK